MPQTSDDSIEVIWYRHPQVWVLILLTCISILAAVWVLATPGALLIELLELRAETQDARQQLKNALAESSLAASRHAKEISDQFDMIRLRDQRVLDLERLLDGKRVRTSFPRSSKSSTSRHSVDEPRTVAIDIDKVYAANSPSVYETLAKARAGQNTEVASAAKAAARNYVPAISSITRYRKTARRLTDEAKSMFTSIGEVPDPSRYHQVVDIQRRALAADPVDIEIAGNLAMYLLRAGDPDAALKYAIYAMSLPRSSESTGRTTDWSTIAAALAVRGDQAGAANALFVTLAISADVRRRCEVAVQATRKIYGPVLRSSTEAMFQRILERQLSDAPECVLPIAW